MPDTDIRGLVMNNLGEPLNVEWEIHSLYANRKRDTIIGAGVMFTISAIIVVWWMLYFHFSLEGGLCFMPLIIGGIITMLFIGIISSRIAWMNMPKSFAFTSQGAHFRYATKGRRTIPLESVAWDDIKDIPNADEALSAPEKTRLHTIIKVGDKELWLDLAKEVQRRFIKDWRQHRPRSWAEKDHLAKNSGRG